MDADRVARMVARELEMAREARRKGNEGMARVCARRAAGWAASWHLADKTGRPFGVNAYDTLLLLARWPEAPKDLRAAARRLTTRITPDHRLPFDEDPLEDAEAIVRALLPEGLRPLPTQGRGPDTPS